MDRIDLILKELDEEGYEATYCKDNIIGEFIQVFYVDSKDEYEVKHIKNIFLNKNCKVSEISVIFLDICNEKLLNEVKKSNKKIKKLIKDIIDENN